MKKALKYIGYFFIGLMILAFIGGFIDEPVENEKVAKKNIIKAAPSEINKISKEDLSIEAHTICKILVENQIKNYLDITFPFANRKIFKKDNQRYIVKDYVTFLDNGIKRKSNWHCDIQYKGGDKMDINNWTILNIEIL